MVDEKPVAIEEDEIDVDGDEVIPPTPPERRVEILSQMLAQHERDAQVVREQIAALIVRSGWGLVTLQAAPVTLEEVFVKLTTREDLPDGRQGQ